MVKVWSVQQCARMDLFIPEGLEVLCAHQRIVLEFFLIIQGPLRVGAGTSPLHCLYLADSSSNSSFGVQLDKYADDTQLYL